MILELDGKSYPAEYGKSRPDIGALFMPEAARLRLRMERACWDLGKSWHEVAVKILARDRSGYYDGGRKLRFKME